GWGNSKQRSMSSGEKGGTNNTWNSGSSHDTKQQAREVLTVDELLSLPTRQAIVFPGWGMRPVTTWLLRWFEELQLWERPGLITRCWRGCTMLCLSVLMFCGMAFLAWY